ncbi:MAG: pimeloyl-CoA dehydrogenase small subunit [Gammaproteobacteria bacterium]|nr:pimeloyl-CoA dehydrogenase small subunit [Gammaproteobacteria bacterium]
MNFDYSEEQVMLRDSVQRFVQSQYEFETRRSIAESETAMSAENWAQFAELGWLSIPFDEQYGGFGGDIQDIAAVMEEMGKGLVIEPFFANVILFGGLLQNSGNDALKEKYIPQIIDGSLQGAYAFVERQSRYQSADVLTSANKQGDNYVLNGTKTVVFNGANADVAVVSARTSGGQSDEDGISLLLVDLSSDGVSRQNYRLMDGQLVANIEFKDVSVSADNLLGAEGQGYVLMKAAELQGSVALAAEALGIAGKLNELTLDYTKTREQFGTTISTFQVLQHRMVDTFMEYELLKSMLFRALCSWADGDDEFELDVRALKAKLARSGKLIGDEAIQIHGGMGMTDEMSVGHYVKRLMTINAIFGDGDYNQQQFVQLQDSAA